MTADNRTVVASIGRDTYSTKLSTDKHSLIADEPPENGGRDTGPAPGDFMRMALASCTAITLRMYADRKKLDVERIDVTVSSKRTDYKCEITITGNITDEQRTRMEEIAHKCPVHNVLSHPIEVDTWIAR
jgi:putative redox protein